MLNLFGSDYRYKDEARSLYEDFINYFKNRRIIWGLKYKKEFFKLIAALSTISENEDIAARAKEDPLLAKELEKYDALKGGVPMSQFLAGHGRVILIDSLEKKLKDPKISPKLKNMRNLLDSYFSIYEDDKVKFSLKLHKILFFEAEGLVKDIKVPLEKMQNLPMNMGKEELLTVEIVLLEEGNDRRKHEEVSKIYETDAEIDYYLNLDFQKEVLNSLPEELKTERLKLFGVNTVDELTEAKDFGFTYLTSLSTLFEQIKDPKYPNQQLLELDSPLMEIEFDKMRQWLTRSNPDGHNGYA